MLILDNTIMKIKALLYKRELVMRRYYILTEKVITERMEVMQIHTFHQIKEVKRNNEQLRW